MKRPILIAMDLEGVLIPEVWIAVAERTDIKQLRRTTRDIPDYDELMRGRLACLREHDLTLKDLQNVIADMPPLEGAAAFLQDLRRDFEVVILSDTFYEFAGPFMEKLAYPTLFCNSLEIDEDGVIRSYRLRQKDGKRRAVEAFRNLHFDVIAAGDSYNDTSMLGAAHSGILFRPSEKVAADFPHYPVAVDYPALRQHIHAFRDTR